MSGWSNSTYRVELVVSGRIAATLPLPAAPRGFSAAIDEKSLVNDSAEMLGAALLLLAADVDVAAGALLELDEELELDELPHAATPTLAHTARAAKTGLRFSKCNDLSSFSP